MKILYLPNSPVPSMAANSVHVMKMAQALGKLGHHVTLLSPEFKRKKSVPVVGNIFDYYGVHKVFEYHRLFAFGTKRVKLKMALLFLRAILKVNAPDLVFSRNPSGALTALQMGMPTIFEWHDSFNNALPAQREIMMKIISHPKLLALVVVSEALKKEISDKFVINQESVIVAHDGADLSLVNTSILTDTSKIRIGYAGHLYQGRGIEIIAGVAQKLQNIEFHIVGGNPTDVDFWKNEIGQNSNIIFHGYQPPSLIPRYLASFDILIAPYQRSVSVASGSDGTESSGNTADWMSPLKIFEYMASGKAIICSNLPVLREVLRNGENCLLCEPDQISDWVHAILKLADNHELRMHLSSQSFSDFKEKYTWTARAKNILNQAGAEGSHCK